MIIIQNVLNYFINFLKKLLKKGDALIEIGNLKSDIDNIIKQNNKILNENDNLN